MQQFKDNIRHIPGKENAADALSRLPVDSAADAAIKETEEYARIIIADAIPASLTPRQLRENPSEILPCNGFPMPSLLDTGRNSNEQRTNMLKMNSG